MKQRNIVVCILLSLVTCGIYGIYWMIVLNDETNALSGRQGTSCLLYTSPSPRD